MSDSLQFVVDETVTAKGAARRATTLRTSLVDTGWILAAPRGASVHRPGPRVGSRYTRAKRELDFTKLATNEVAIETGPFTNLAVGPFDADRLRCPKCTGAVPEDSLMACVGEWMSGEGDAVMKCEGCRKKVHLRELRSRSKGDPPVVCGYLALSFYNWPPLDAPGWKKSIVDVIEDALGARPSIAWTKL